MPQRVFVGTSGYNYPEWRGTFYPEKFSTDKMLAYYAERFPTVEINYTFYRMPNAKTMAAWDAETPAGFRFTLKVPQRITHIARLRDIDDSLRYFLDTARGLGPKLGPVLFQLPPNFKKDLARLDGLLTRLPADVRCALEFRHDHLLPLDRPVLWPKLRESLSKSSEMVVVAERQVKRDTGLANRLDEFREELVFPGGSCLVGKVAVEDRARGLRIELREFRHDLFEPRGHPRRRRFDRDVSNDLPDVARAATGVLN